MDHSTLALTFTAIIFPVFTAGAAGLPLATSNAPRIVLLPIQLLLYFFAALDLLVSVYIALSDATPPAYISPLLTQCCALGTTFFFFYVLFIMSWFAVQGSLVDGSGIGQDRKNLPQRIST